MHSYKTAQSVLTLLTSVGWCIVCIAAASPLATLDAGLGAAIALAIPLAATGFILIAAVQIARAQIDTAINTREICNLLRESSATTATEEPRAPRSLPPKAAITCDVVKTHRGENIYRTPGGYLARGEIYYSVAAAEQAIDEQR